MKPQFNRTLKRPLWLLASLVLATALMAPHAFADTNDTDAGDTIINIATINYQVGGVVQPAEDSSPASFVVDHKVRPEAVQVQDDTAVPGETDQVLRYTVTNDGNTDSDTGAVLEIQLTAVQGVDGTDDDFDVIATSIRIYADTDGSGDLDTGLDTLVTNYGGAPGIGTISLGRDLSMDIYLLSDMPSGALAPADGQTALIHLVATAWNGAVVLAEDGADDPNASEVVFADDAGTWLPTDGTFNGLHSASAVYTIATATLGVTKTSSVVSDPFNTVAPFYRVPGARVQYEIVVSNNGAADATNLQVVDRIPVGTDYIDGSVTATAGVASIQYSNEAVLPPTMPSSWVYSPTFDANGVDTNLTWIRINLTNPVAGTVPGPAGSATTQFDVFIR